MLRTSGPLQFFCLFFADVSGDVHTAGAGMRQGVGDTAAVADDEEALAAGLQVFIYFDLHVLEFDFYAIQQRIIVCRSRSDLIKRIDHLDNAVENTLRKHKA